MHILVAFSFDCRTRPYRPRRKTNGCQKRVRPPRFCSHGDHRSDNDAVLCLLTNEIARHRLKPPALCYHRLIGPCGNRHVTSNWWPDNDPHRLRADRRHLVAQKLDGVTSRGARGRRRLLVVELDTPHPLVLSLNPVALKQVLAWCSVQRCAATLASTRQLEMP